MTGKKNPLHDQGMNAKKLTLSEAEENSYDMGAVPFQDAGKKPASPLPGEAGQGADQEELRKEEEQAGRLEDGEQEEKEAKGKAGEEKEEGVKDVVMQELQELQDLKERNRLLEEEKEELSGRLLRLQADFDNYRKRVRAEKEDLVQNANFNLMGKLLPVVDNLERACNASGGCAESFVEGVQMITRHFLEVMQKEGVEPIACKGKPFDPTCHEAVLQEESFDHPAQTVLEELQKGYKMNDKVLRASVVKVST